MVYPGALKRMSCATMGSPKETVPAPTEPNSASPPFPQVVGEVQLALVVFQRKSPEVFAHVFGAGTVIVPVPVIGAVEAP